jgi:inorganic pyrophosphatase
MADPVRLKPIDPETEDLVVVVIETPKGNRNKYAYDPKEHIFELKKRCYLPAWPFLMIFVYRFLNVSETWAVVFAGGEEGLDSGDADPCVHCRSG